MDKKTIQKEIAIGFIVGLIANAVGVFLYTLVIMASQHTSITETITMADSNGNLSKIIALGAVVNIAAFFGFLKIKRDYRARGVILATLLMAVGTFIYQFV